MALGNRLGKVELRVLLDKLRYPREVNSLIVTGIEPVILFEDASK
jgi:hypothetical protein